MKALHKVLIIVTTILISNCSHINETTKMGKFRYSICEPLNPKIIEKGEIRKDSIIQVFKEFPWNKYLEQITTANENDIHYSPSLEFENKLNSHGITASAVGEPNNFEFYVFYKRPKNKKHLFGLIEKLDKNYISDILNQSEKDVIDCLNALINNDIDFLEDKFR